MTVSEHLRAAEQSMLSADSLMTPDNRDDAVCAALHTAMFYLEIAIHNADENPRLNSRPTARVQFTEAETTAEPGNSCKICSYPCAGEFCPDCQHERV